MFEKYKYFTPLDIDMSKEWGCKIVGVFGYSIARVDSKNVLPKMPRDMFSKFEQALMEKKVPVSNKMVVICQDTTNFGTDNFAVNLKDMYACVGKWTDVVGYSGELELKENAEV